MVVQRGWLRSRRTLVIGGIVLLVIALAVGGFALFTSYRMSLIPGMTFEEMLAFTTGDNQDARITVGIIKGGEKSFTLYGGDSATLPPEEYPYEIGSVTKTFTTALLSKALGESKVQLDDSIDRILVPEEGSAARHYPTLAQIATHTAGYRNFYLEWPLVRNIVLREGNSFYGVDSATVVDRVHKVSVADRQHDFRYSNFGMATLGQALARLEGEEFATLLDTYIASELGLEHTHVSSGADDLEGAWRWQRDDGYLPAGAVISTIGDMLAYVELHMSDALPYLALAHKPVAEVNATTGQLEQVGIRIDSVGLGWMIDGENGFLWHNGGTSNYNSYVAFDKERQVGVVILSNLSPNYRIPATLMGIKLMKTLQAGE